MARIGTMAIIAIEYTYDVAQSELIAEHRPTHRAHLRDLHDAGPVLTFGPLGDDSALILVEADSPEAGLNVLTGDPFLPSSWESSLRWHSGSRCPSPSRGGKSSR